MRVHYCILQAYSTHTYSTHTCAHQALVKEQICPFHGKKNAINVLSMATLFALACYLGRAGFSSTLPARSKRASSKTTTENPTGCLGSNKEPHGPSSRQHDCGRRAALDGVKRAYTRLPFAIVSPTVQESGYARLHSARLHSQRSIVGGSSEWPNQ